MGWEIKKLQRMKNIRPSLTLICPVDDCNNHAHAKSFSKTGLKGKLVERSEAVITIDGVYAIGEELEILCVVGNFDILESPESGGFWSILKNVTKVSSAFCTGDLRPD